MIFGGMRRAIERSSLGSVGVRFWDFGEFNQGAFTYDVRFLGRQVGQAESDFPKQAYVVKYLISKFADQGRQVIKKYPKNIRLICYEFNICF